MRGITDDGVSLRIVRGNAEVGVKEYFGELWRAIFLQVGDRLDICELVYWRKLTRMTAKLFFVPKASWLGRKATEICVAKKVSKWKFYLDDWWEQLWNLKKVSQYLIIDNREPPEITDEVTGYQKTLS